MVQENVLNLSGTSRYESGTATGDDIDTLKIEVTTLTLQELADLADASITAEDSYCGIDLADVDLFYFPVREITGQSRPIWSLRQP